MMWCQAEQPEELQLACAHILCSHASSLLLDKDRCLGKEKLLGYEAVEIHIQM